MTFFSAVSLRRRCFWWSVLEDITAKFKVIKDVRRTFFSKSLHPHYMLMHSGILHFPLPKFIFIRKYMR